MTTESILKKHFPMLRTAEEVMQDIQENPHLRRQYQAWPEERRQEFMDICTGARGVKMVYDTFFKEVMNPEYTPERVGDFLSVLLKQKVTVLHALTNDTVRIGAENSLLYTDLVVKLEDGSYANIEIQKIGYLFPGQRAACYSADLLLRQYKRVRAEANDVKGKKFSYKDIMPVYTIVLFEHSPQLFHEFPDDYLHYIEAKSDTGIKVPLLQRYLFIPLDIFKKNVQNKINIDNKVEAWLRFFSVVKCGNLLFIYVKNSFIPRTSMSVGA